MLKGTLNSSLRIGGSTLADAQHMPPQGSRFFHFDTQKFRNVTASGVHAPLRGPRSPPAGNPRSATATVNSYKKFVF